MRLVRHMHITATCQACETEIDVEIFVGIGYLEVTQYQNNQNQKIMCVFHRFKVLKVA